MRTVKIIVSYIHDVGLQAWDEGTSRIDVLRELYNMTHGEDAPEGMSEAEMQDSLQQAWGIFFVGEKEVQVTAK